MPLVQVLDRRDRLRRLAVGLARGESYRTIADDPVFTGVASSTLSRAMKQPRWQEAVLKEQALVRREERQRQARERDQERRRVRAAERRYEEKIGVVELTADGHHRIVPTERTRPEPDPDPKRVVRYRDQRGRIISRDDFERRTEGAWVDYADGSSTLQGAPQGTLPLPVPDSAATAPEYRPRALLRETEAGLARVDREAERRPRRRKTPYISSVGTIFQSPLDMARGLEARATLGGLAFAEASPETVRWLEGQRASRVTVRSPDGKRTLHVSADEAAEYTAAGWAA